MLLPLFRAWAVPPLMWTPRTNGGVVVAKMIGPRKIHSYGNEFKATAVKLSHLHGVQVQDVAEVLDIYPFMLSRWRKEYRQGLCTGIDRL